MRQAVMTRNLDSLGRLVFPVEIRRSLDLTHRSEIEIYVEEDCIILKKREVRCVFCGQ